MLVEHDLRAVLAVDDRDPAVRDGGIHGGDVQVLAVEREGVAVGEHAAGLLDRSEELLVLGVDRGRGQLGLADDGPGAQERGVARDLRDDGLGGELGAQRVGHDHEGLRLLVVAGGGVGRGRGGLVVGVHGGGHCRGELLLIEVDAHGGLDGAVREEVRHPRVGVGALAGLLRPGGPVDGEAKVARAQREVEPVARHVVRVRRELVLDLLGELFDREVGGIDAAHGGAGHEARGEVLPAGDVTDDEHQRHDAGDDARALGLLAVLLGLFRGLVNRGEMLCHVQSPKWFVFGMQDCS